MTWGIVEIIEMNISKVLEALFDEVEYRLARRALRQASKVKAKSNSRIELLIDEVIPT